MAPKRNFKQSQTDETKPASPSKKRKTEPEASTSSNASARLIEPQLPQKPFYLTAGPPTRHRKTKEWTFDQIDPALDFHPNVSPEEMLRRGVFGGSYFRPYYSKKLKQEFHDDWSDLPHEWYEGLDVDRYLLQHEYDPTVCQWKAKVGQSIEEWEAANWIEHSYDVRGWFQWYCRFFMGRRCDDDARQIKRWTGVAGRTGRWRRILLSKYQSARVVEISPTEETVSPAIRQTLLHWAFDVTTAHLNMYLEDKGLRVPNPDDSQDESDHEQEAREQEEL